MESGPTEASQKLPKETRSDTNNHQAIGRKLMLLMRLRLLPCAAYLSFNYKQALIEKQVIFYTFRETQLVSNRHCNHAKIHLRHFSDNKLRIDFMVVLTKSPFSCSTGLRPHADACRCMFKKGHKPLLAAREVAQPLGETWHLWSSDSSAMGIVHSTPSSLSSTNSLFSGL